ncbi:MAG: AsmA family protein [Desulfobacteraceae bacterium]|nr:AsmA family protein [Desulfobacteraceae bacterium]
MKLKKILAVITGLIVLLIIGLFILVSSYDFSDQVKKVADVVHTYTGRKLVIKGKTDLKLSLTPSLVLQDLSFANADWSKTSEMVKADKFEIQLDLIPLLKGDIVIKRFVLKNSEILIEKSKQGVMNYTFTREHQKPKHQKKDRNQNTKVSFSNIVFNEFIIEDCKIIFLDAKTKKQEVLSIKHIRAAAIDLTHPVDLNVIANYDHLNILVKGSIGSIASLLKKEQKYPFELSTVINNSDFKLKGNIIDAFNKKTPLVELDIHSNHIDAASFLAKKLDTKKENLQKPNTNTKLFPSENISLDFLDILNIEADINLKKFVSNKVSIQNISSKMVMQKGTLVLKPLSASAFNGEFYGSTTIKAIKNNLNIICVLNVKELDTHLLTSQLELKKGLNGLVNGKLQLKGRGNSVAQIMGDLKGFFWGSMKDGKIDAGFVQSLGTDMVTNVFGFLNPFDEEAKSNALNCAALRIEFVKGIGEIKLLLADMPSMAASGKGQIDLNKETLDISVKPSPKKGIGTKELGNINLSLSQLAKAFKIGGTLKSPEINIDHAEATKSLAKTAGGILFFGPVGIVAALVGANKADQNPCPCALAIAKDGNDKNCNTTKNNTKEIKKPDTDESFNPIKKLLNIFN